MPLMTATSPLSVSLFRIMSRSLNDMLFSGGSNLTIIVQQLNQETRPAAP